MKIEIPKPPKLRDDGEYGVMVGKGYGDPRGTISLDDKWELVLDDLRPADCDGLIKALAEIKERVLAYQAELARPHGTRHLYKGTCQLCGKPEDDELHADPAAVPAAPADAGTPIVITGDAARACGQHALPGGWCLIEGEHAEHRNAGGLTWTNYGYSRCACSHGLADHDDDSQQHECRVKGCGCSRWRLAAPKAAPEPPAVVAGEVEPGVAALAEVGVRPCQLPEVHGWENSPEHGYFCTTAAHHLPASVSA